MNSVTVVYSTEHWTVHTT